MCCSIHRDLKMTWEGEKKMSDAAGGLWEERLKLKEINAHSAFYFSAISVNYCAPGEKLQLLKAANGPQPMPYCHRRLGWLYWAYIRDLWCWEALIKKTVDSPSLSLWGGSTVQLGDLSSTLNNHIGNHPFYSTHKYFTEIIRGCSAKDGL